MKLSFYFLSIALFTIGTQANAADSRAGIAAGRFNLDIAGQNSGMVHKIDHTNAGTPIRANVDKNAISPTADIEQTTFGAMNNAAKASNEDSKQQMEAVQNTSNNKGQFRAAQGSPIGISPPASVNEATTQANCPKPPCGLGKAVVRQPMVGDLRPVQKNQSEGFNIQGQIESQRKAEQAQSNTQKKKSDTEKGVRENIK